MRQLVYFWDRNQIPPQISLSPNIILLALKRVFLVCILQTPSSEGHTQRRPWDWCLDSRNGPFGTEALKALCQGPAWLTKTHVSDRALGQTQSWILELDPRLREWPLSPHLHLLSFPGRNGSHYPGSGLHGYWPVSLYPRRSILGSVSSLLWQETFPLSQGLWSKVPFLWRLDELGKYHSTL